MKTIVLTDKAAKQLDNLPEAAQFAVTEALALYAITGRGDVKKLAGREGYRMRVGSYRVLFAEDAETVLAAVSARQPPMGGIENGKAANHRDADRRRVGRHKARRL